MTKIIIIITMVKFMANIEHLLCNARNCSKNLILTNRKLEGRHNNSPGLQMKKLGTER